MRVIIHIDVDCFYAQVEMVKNPQIANSPVGVLQNQTISTCNYVARQRGLKKMTHRTDALKMVPDLIVVQANMESYRLASAESKFACEHTMHHNKMNSFREIY